MKAKRRIATRFPPSPTGFLHIGGARTALFNHLFAAKEGGTMYLRFEDTDPARSNKEFETEILEGLEWLGIPYRFPEGISPRQSERSSVYREYVQQLLRDGKAYEAEVAEGTTTKNVVRFRNPRIIITFTDLIRGPMSFDTSELKDFVIGRSVGEPLYHLAVVIDDHDMGVTHVIRGEDHISNTPRQILLLEALGFKRPQYAHIPLILAPDRSKLSKRHGAVSVNEYRRDGFIPEALVNHLALLGWSPGNDRELYTLAELEGAFSLERVQKGGAVFDLEKLRWFNREHLRRLSDDEYLARLQGFAAEARTDASGARRVVSLLRERASTLKEALLMLSGELSFAVAAPTPKPSLLPWKGEGATVTKKHLAEAERLLRGVPNEKWSAEHLKSAIFPYAEKSGKGSVLWPLRVALTGLPKSPDPFTVAAILGKDEVLARMRASIAVL